MSKDDITKKRMQFHKYVVISFWDSKLGEIDFHPVQSIEKAVEDMISDARFHTLIKMPEFDPQLHEEFQELHRKAEEEYEKNRLKKNELYDLTYDLIPTLKIEIATMEGFRSFLTDPDSLQKLEDQIVEKKIKLKESEEILAKLTVELNERGYY